MSIRSKEDVVHAYNDYHDLMNRIYKLLDIYRKWNVLHLKKYRYIRLKEITDVYITVELLKLEENKHYTTEDIIDPMAGPAGFSAGWEPLGEDIIGSREIYDGSSWALKVVETINIPYSDVSIADDEMLKDIEKGYQSTYEEKKRKEHIEQKRAELDKKRKEIEDITKELEEMKMKRNKK